MVEYDDEHYFGRGIKILKNLGGLVAVGGGKNYYDEWFPRMKFEGRTIKYSPFSTIQYPLPIGMHEEDFRKIAGYIVMGIGYNPPLPADKPQSFLFWIEANSKFQPAIDYLIGLYPSIKRDRINLPGLFIPPFRRNRSH